MSEYNVLLEILKSDLKWCLVHKDDQTGNNDDDRFNHGYCGGRINLVKVLIAEIEVLQIKEEIKNEDR